jgi:hypothetical protein
MNIDTVYPAVIMLKRDIFQILWGRNHSLQLSRRGVLDSTGIPYTSIPTNSGWVSCGLLISHTVYR